MVATDGTRWGNTTFRSFKEEEERDKCQQDTFCGSSCIVLKTAEFYFLTIQ